MCVCSVCTPVCVCAVCARPCVCVCGVCTPVCVRVCEPAARGSFHPLGFGKLGTVCIFPPLLPQCVKHCPLCIGRSVNTCSRWGAVETRTVRQEEQKQNTSGVRGRALTESGWLRGCEKVSDREPRGKAPGKNSQMQTPSSGTRCGWFGDTGPAWLVRGGQ